MTVTTPNTSCVLIDFCGQHFYVIFSDAQCFLSISALIGTKHDKNMGILMHNIISAQIQQIGILSKSNFIENSCDQG
jgi:hypothetical protein